MDAKTIAIQKQALEAITDEIWTKKYGSAHGKKDVARMEAKRVLMAKKNMRDGEADFIKANENYQASVTEDKISEAMRSLAVHIFNQHAPAGYQESTHTATFIASAAHNSQSTEMFLKALTSDLSANEIEMLKDNDGEGMEEVLIKLTKDYITKQKAMIENASRMLMVQVVRQTAAMKIAAHDAAMERAMSRKRKKSPLDAFMNVGKPRALTRTHSIQMEQMSQDFVNMSSQDFIGSQAEESDGGESDGDMYNDLV